MDNGENPWVRLDTPLPCRTTRRRIFLSDDFLRETAEHFARKFGRPVPCDEARVIAENVLAYLECLVDPPPPA